MSAKPVSLSVHKNKVEARRKRVLAKELRRHVEGVVREQDVRAYAIVGISADGSAFSFWDTGATMPIWAFADTVAHVLREDIRNSDVEDDWRPALSVKGSTNGA
jgi:transcription elongation factor